MSQPPNLRDPFGVFLRACFLDYKQHLADGKISLNNEQLIEGDPELFKRIHADAGALFSKSEKGIIEANTEDEGWEA